jgi:SulP family sulfate permease
MTRLPRRVQSFLGNRRALGTDAVAGVPGAIASVPDGMASAVLVGVNPVYGLYASMAGPIAGGLAVSTRLMVVTTTTAAALAAGSALSGFTGAQRSEALFLLSAVAGLMMIAAGLLRLGRYTRFVSVSVLTGFLTGVAVNIILGQLGDLLGSPQKGRPAIVKAWNVLTHPSEMSLTAAAVGLGALALMLLVSRTRLTSIASLIALVIPTLLTLGADNLVRVQDSGPIPTGIPTPHLPQLSLLSSLQLIAGAAAITVIVLVQGTGVAEAAPNPDGSLSDANRDFIGQGLGNLASGLLRGQPVGGSVSQTALNRAAGARGRWASIFSGVWMLLILVVFSGVVGRIPIPTLAAVLIFAAASSLRVRRIDTVLRAGAPARIAFIATLAATLVLPVAAAVGVGVGLSLLLQLNQEAIDLKLVHLTLQPDGCFVESPAPAILASADVTILDVYGSLRFAGARTLETRLPDPGTSKQPVVVLRLRGRTRLGATGLIVLGAYANRLASAGGHLYLSGVDPLLVKQLRTSRRIDPDLVAIVPATETLLDSTRGAYDQAKAWLLEHQANEHASAPCASVTSSSEAVRRTVNGRG